MYRNVYQINIRFVFNVSDSTKKWVTKQEAEEEVSE